jgi:membrane fusion protein (multidrug efflux system)
MQKLLIAAGVLGAIVVVAGTSYWAGKSSATAAGPVGAAPPTPASGPPPPGVVVEASRVSVVKLPQALNAVGSLRSDETVVVRPEVAGRIANFEFREGERVTEGQVLVRLDDSVQKADLSRARANLVLSRTKHERAIDLRNKGFVSTQALDELENSVKVAEADAELMTARVNKMTLRAPFAGTVGLRQASVGDYVKEGQDIVNLESLDPLKVDFRLPELALSQLRNSQTLQISLDALPDKAYDGKVYAINPLLDANGRSIVIRAQVPNRDGKLRPGMFARVRLFTSDNRDSVVIPEEALFPVGDDKYVYKVVDGKAQRQKVEIGQRREGRVEIMNGLARDDVVVTAGVIKLREGVAVTIANNSPAPAPVGKSDEPPAKPKG